MLHLKPNRENEETFKKLIAGIDHDKTTLENFLLSQNGKLPSLLKERSEEVTGSLFATLSQGVDISKTDVRDLLIENADQIDVVAFLQAYYNFATGSSSDSGEARLPKTLEMYQIAFELEKMKGKMKDETLKVLKEENNILRQKAENVGNILAIMGHDLRSPLTSLTGLLELMSQGGLSEEEAKEYLGVASTATKTTLELLTHLLQRAQLKNTSVAAVPEEFHMKSHIADQMAVLALAADKKSIKLENHVDDDVKVTADKEMVDTIVRNLINNAIKFTNTDGKIRVSSRVTDDGGASYLEISVADNGVGMSPALQKEIFEDHKVTTKRGTKGEKGTGLGLVLCKNFVEQCGGKIRVESEEGKGSTFRFTLPLAAAEVDA